MKAEAHVKCFHNIGRSESTRQNDILFNLYLCLEEVLCAADADLVDVDLALARQHAQPRVLAQLARRRLPEDQQELTEVDVAVAVLVNLLIVKLINN